MGSPFDPLSGAQIKGQSGAIESQAFVGMFQESPELGLVADVLAAVTDNGSEQIITTGFTNPTPARVVTATSGGTAGDIGAIQVIVTGKNLGGETITETLPIFTADAATTVVGSKAFADVTSVTIPAHDGTGATTSIGSGNALGLAHELIVNTVMDGMVYFGGTVESTEPTITTSVTLLEENTVTFDTTLDGSEVILFYVIPSNA